MEQATAHPLLLQHSRGRLQLLVKVAAALLGPPRHVARFVAGLLGLLAYAASNSYIRRETRHNSAARGAEVEARRGRREIREPC